MLARRHWQRRIAQLDPEHDYERIYRITVAHEFPWDMLQALSFALFRTYAVPSIGRLLDETGEFDRRTQKRYDDTALLLDEPAAHGLHSDAGLAAIRRVNQMHGSFDISNDDMRYVLSTFVVTPKRWIDDVGWRVLSPAEVRASVLYYRELGRLMGIKQIPETFEEFETLLDAYEAEHFAFDESSRRVADSTLRLMTTFYPRLLAGPVTMFSKALMDQPLLEAFGYPAPPGRVVALSRAALRARARVVAHLPSRRTPHEVAEHRRIRSYPLGFEVEKLGTFPRGCPVEHSA